MKWSVDGASAIAGLLLLGSFTLGSAHASTASLGGLESGTLFSDRMMQVEKSCPTVVDSFNVANRVLHGHSVSAGQGQSWTSPVSYTISGSAAAVTGPPPPSGTVFAAIPWLATDTSIAANMSITGIYKAGLALHVDTSANSAMTLQLLSGGSNRTRLVKVVDGVDTVIASVNFTPASGTWRFEYRDGSYRVSFNGDEKLVYPSSTAEQAAWDAEKNAWTANTQVGLVAVGPQPLTRWDEVTMSCL